MSLKTVLMLIDQMVDKMLIIFNHYLFRKFYINIIYKYINFISLKE